VSTVIRGALNRIGRAVETHDSMKLRILARHERSLNAETVLKEECERAGLQCQQKDRTGILAALDRGRICLLRYRMTKGQLHAFSDFFKQSPTDTMISDELPDDDGTTKTGHSVVIYGYRPFVWTIKNSWGTGFGNEGFFAVTADWIEKVEGIMYDVYL